MIRWTSDARGSMQLQNGITYICNRNRLETQFHAGFRDAKENIPCTIIYTETKILTHRSNENHIKNGERQICY
jgi:hypothetical protein